ncbi:CD44 antigen-like, partial [Clarias magur]
LTAHLEPDAEFLEDAVAEGFIVSTEEPTKTEKPQDHNDNGIITHDSLNQEASQSRFQNDSLPTGTIAKTPEASPKLTGENTKELPKNESAAVLNTVGTRKNTAPTSEENAEGSGILPGEVEHAASVDDASERSDLSFKTLNEKQDKDDQFDGSGMRPEVIETIVEAVTVPENPVLFRGKENRKLAPAHDGQAEGVKEGTPDWLIILALCLTLVAVICVFVAIGTKD